MLLNEIKHLATEHIWLVPMYENGQLGYVWCDDPAPGADMVSEDAVEYIRKDVHEARVVELEQERDKLAAHVRRLDTILFDTFLVIEDGEYVSIPYDVYLKAYNETPETSLARLKSKAQADFIDGLLKNHLEFTELQAGPIVDLLVRLETGLRQQAKELKSD